MKYLGTLILFLSFISNIFSQCIDWINPNSEEGWTDFMLVPCNGATEAFPLTQVNQSEAWSFLDCLQGSVYRFSHCNGASGSWPPEYTIIAPSGAVDAFGSGDGDGCSITWTASESGEYLVVINQEGGCGIPGSVNNGFPMITTLSGGRPCEQFLEGAESFEGEGLPDCWQAIDLDGDGNNWNLRSGDGSFEGETVIISESWIQDAGALTPNNYLVTPQLELGEGDSLYYVITAVDQVYPAENYSVLVSTTGTNIEDFTDVVFTEVLQGVEWKGRVIDLSAYDNQSIYIAFRHHDVTDQFFFAIDAVKLPGNVICNPLSDGISDKSSQELQVYPNPSTGKFFLEYDTQDLYEVEILNMEGRVVYSTNSSFLNSNRNEIDLASLSTGVYLVRVISPMHSQYKKIVIQ